MGDAEHFRIFFWQKLTPLLVLPVFVLIFAVSPVPAGWSATTWGVCAAMLGAAVTWYLWRAWRQSGVLLDDEGMTLYLGGSLETWPYRKLLKVKQIGKYRVRMCYDPDIPDKHMHITVDVFGSDGFVDALLDRYALAMGYELPELESHAA
jgi:hypothetical protein